MKKTLLIIGLLLLTGCASNGDKWKTQIVVDEERTKAIYQAFHHCVGIVFPTGSTAKGIKDYIMGCDDEYWENIRISDNPPTFYGLSDREVEWKTYGEFVSCIHTLSRPDIDIPDDMTPNGVKEYLRYCLDLFPKH